MALAVALADLADPAVAELVARHVAFCDATSPPESCHRLPLEELAAPDVTVFAAWHEGALAGIGALKALCADAGEVKSMHTDANKRGLGIGSALLSVIMEDAVQRGFRTLWLETGTSRAFDAARALYERHGFVSTEPFGAYVLDPHSAYYVRALGFEEAAAS